MFPESPKDFWESQADADFDDERFDEVPGIMARLLRDGLTYEEWLDVMTPIWQEQLKNMGIK